MVVKNIIIYIVLFVFVLWFIHSIRRTFKTIKEFLMPAKDINLNSLSDDKKDDFISNVIFAKMTREQKYAYIYTIESFLSFADNTPENIDKDMTDIVKKQGILATYNYTLKLLNLKEEDIDKAISFFDNDYLTKVSHLLKKPIK